MSNVHCYVSASAHCIPLSSLFFILTSMAIWIDQLCFGYIGIFSSHMMLYKGVDIFIFIVSKHSARLVPTDVNCVS